MLVVLCYLVCAVVWGTTWFAIRVCIGEGGYPTFPAAAIRFTIATLLLLIVVRGIGWGRPGPRSARQWRWLIIAGVFNCAGYALVYRAEETLPGGLVAVLFGTYPLLTGLIAAVTGTEKVRTIDIVSALIALVGMVILFWDRMSVSAEQAVGVAFAMAGVFASVGYSIVFKREANDIHPLSSTTVFLGVSALGLWLVSGAVGSQPLPWPPPVEPSMALVYLAVFGSVFTFVCYFYLLRNISLMATSSLVLVQPVIALIVDALWEAEAHLVARSYLGIAIILGGLAFAMVWKWRAARLTLRAARAVHPQSV